MFSQDHLYVIEVWVSLDDCAQGTTCAQSSSGKGKSPSSQRSHTLTPPPQTPKPTHFKRSQKMLRGSENA
eukprot:6343756-Amphidinium_carterae.1